MWKQLSAEEKKPLEEQVEKDKQRYEREKKAYKPPAAAADSESGSESGSSSSSSSSSGSEKPKKKKKRAKKDPDAPKHPLNAYMMFVNEIRGKVQEELKVGVFCPSPFLSLRPSCFLLLPYTCVFL
jgi:hypothetical protein